MYKIDGTTINLTRGDTLEVLVGIKVKISDCEYQDYSPEPGDTVRFALKHATNKRRTDGYIEFKDDEPLIRKEIPTDSLILKLDPSDTKSLGFGNYKYDIELTYADGRVDTFIPNGDFNIREEVD